MNKHPHFTLKSTNFYDESKNFDYLDYIHKKYSNNEFRLIGYDLAPGLLVFMGLDRENKPIYKSIDKIIEERPSLGEFPNHLRPTSYRVIIQ